MTVSSADHSQWLRFGVTSIRNATFANPLFLPVVFANPAKFLAETFVKPVTANRNVVVATAGFANPVRVTGAVGTPVCVAAGECGVRDRGDFGRGFHECGIRNCCVCESPVPTSSVYESSEVRNRSMCETRDGKL